MSTGMMTTKIFATREFRTEFPSEYDGGKVDVLVATLKIHSLGGQAAYLFSHGQFVRSKQNP